MNCLTYEHKTIYSKLKYKDEFLEMIQGDVILVLDGVVELKNNYVIQYSSNVKPLIESKVNNLLDDDIKKLTEFPALPQPKHL